MFSCPANSSQRKQEPVLVYIALTEKVGGTDASFPVLFARVETGIMTSAFGVGGCSVEDWKKVACSVAVIRAVSGFRIYALGGITYWRIVHRGLSRADCRAAE